jgi:Zn-dependent protease
MNGPFGFGRPGLRPTFHVGPIPVRVELSFLLLVVLTGLSGSKEQLAIWVAVYFFSFLIHELGHAVAYRLRGATSEVLLYLGGGLTWGRREVPLGMGEQIFVSLAGPGAGMVVAGLTKLIAASHPPATALGAFTLETTFFINFWWGLFNLLPVVPMDGGHVMESLLCLRDPLRGRIQARWVSIALCAVLAPLSFVYGYEFAAMMLVFFAIQAYQTLMLLQSSTRAPVLRVQAAPPPNAELPDVIENLARLHKLLAEEQPEQARAVAHQVLGAARGAGARDQALRALAWLDIGAGEPQAALAHLAKTSSTFDDPLTWGTAIAASGDAVNALPHLARAYQRSADPQTVATYARCLAAVGRGDEARLLAGPQAPAESQRALGEALFRSRDYAGSAEISRRLFERAHQPLDAYNLACAEARLGHDEEALRWLRTAVDSGFADREHLLDDPDLAPLRARDEWTEIVSRVPAAG